MRFQKILLVSFKLATLTMLAACTGPKGDLGPSGAQGYQGNQGVPASATYYYNSNFDSQADLSEWTVFKSGGPGTIQTYLDSTAFNSPAKAMGVSVTGTVNGDSFIYKNISFDLTKDIWVEFDWLLQGMTGSNEIVINTGATNKLSIGFDSINVFLTHNGVAYNPAPTISTTQWHHVKMKLDPTTGLSAYWLDGLSIGSGYTTAITPGGTPPTGSFLAIKIGFPAGGKARVDNLICYRY